jgi:hypothetical protein
MRFSVKPTLTLQGLLAESAGHQCRHIPENIHHRAATIAAQRVFVLKFYQAGRPDWTKRVFFAEFNPKANLD